MEGNLKFTMEDITERLGITARTLHYYEEIGLLPTVSRTEGRHRVYDEEMVLRIQLILRLKEVLGASLQEIRDILQAEADLDRLRATFYGESLSEDERENVLDEATDRLRDIIRHIEERMEKLQQLKQGFAERLDRATSLKHRS
ncbi:MerR family transcriptional regulator [Paenibacillus sp. CF384]|uniref:MerR family transcriptional regulator n=1 Tax=Paenibacillus sp. CF384 TaxID=1884382 RepID=UPI00089756BB|nr:MerR family transcriptional regulator [Paenibacillus sp. CF384]SDW18391.1 transcriptional regulator, MerR family [Paenibacillus sp. CF384]